MLDITMIVDRLSACFKCQSDGKPTEGNEPKTKASNINKVVNITISPSQSETVANPDHINIAQKGHNSPPHHSVCFSDEAVVDHPIRPPRPQLKKVRNVVVQDKVDRQISLAEADGIPRSKTGLIRK